MYKLFALAMFIVAGSCKTSEQKTTVAVQPGPTDYVKYISEAELRTNLYTLASDDMEGRKTGEKGQKMAADFIKGFYLKNKVSSPLEGDDYYQEIPGSYFRTGTKINDTENVLAFIEGTEKPDEVIVISAHYDHVGMDEKGNIYNGADDDASGTVAVMQIAKAFQKAKDEGNGPKRSLLFLHVTGEEIGLYGSRYYTENPVFPLENTVANLNIDMIGRVDPSKAGNREYIYLIGSDKLSQELHLVSEKMNSTYVNLELDYKFNDENDPNRFYYRSDHYNFAKNNIPVIFYFNGVHADYHKITDTADKIEYDLLQKRTELIFYTAWELANRTERVSLDIRK